MNAAGRKAFSKWIGKAYKACTRALWAILRSCARKNSPDGDHPHPQPAQDLEAHHVGGLDVEDNLAACAAEAVQPETDILTHHSSSAPWLSLPARSSRPQSHHSVELPVAPNVRRHPVCPAGPSAACIDPEKDASSTAVQQAALGPANEVQAAAAVLAPDVARTGQPADSQVLQRTLNQAEPCSRRSHTPEPHHSYRLSCHTEPEPQPASMAHRSGLAKPNFMPIVNSQPAAAPREPHAVRRPTSSMTARELGPQSQFQRSNACLSFQRLTVRHTWDVSSLPTSHGAGERRNTKERRSSGPSQF